MYNKVIILGTIKTDPYMCLTPKGVKYTRFSILTESRDNQNSILEVIAWGSTAEKVCQCFGKGSVILIEGSIQTRSYNEREEKQWEILAHKVFLQGSYLDNSPPPENPCGDCFHHWGKPYPLS